MLAAANKAREFERRATEAEGRYTATEAARRLSGDAPAEAEGRYSATGTDGRYLGLTSPQPPPSSSPPPLPPALPSSAEQREIEFGLHQQLAAAARLLSESEGRYSATEVRLRESEGRYSATKAALSESEGRCSATEARLHESEDAARQLRAELQLTKRELQAARSDLEAISLELHEAHGRRAPMHMPMSSCRWYTLVQVYLPTGCAWRCVHSSRPYYS